MHVKHALVLKNEEIKYIYVEIDRLALSVTAQVCMEKLQQHLD